MADLVLCDCDSVKPHYDYEKSSKDKIGHGARWQYIMSYRCTKYHNGECDNDYDLCDLGVGIHNIATFKDNWYLTSLMHGNSSGCRRCVVILNSYTTAFQKDKTFTPWGVSSEKKTETSTDDLLSFFEVKMVEDKPPSGVSFIGTPPVEKLTLVAPPTTPPAMAVTPSELGFSLEEIIHNASQLLPGATCLRELEIRTRFSDPSLNGVDHMISVGSTHILAQDKWKESVAQPEVAQFLMCAERIRSRLPSTDTIYLVWISKIPSTSHAKKTLDEHCVNQVICNLSVDALARCAVLKIAECLELDPTPALVSIRSTARPTVMGGARRELAVAPLPPAPVLSYDETEEGARDKTELNSTISAISAILSRITTAISYDASYDVRTLWETQLPKAGDDWWSGRFSKIDYTAFLKAIKAICCPTAKKPLQSRQLYLYVKLRKASVDLATHAVVYDAKRKHMLTKKSGIAKSLPTFKATAEPITEAEFKSSASHCEDYWENRMNRITGRVERVPAMHIDTAFWTQQCMI